MEAWATGQRKEGRCLKGAVLVPDWLQAEKSSAVKIELVREYGKPRHHFGIFLTHMSQALYRSIRAV